MLLPCFHPPHLVFLELIGETKFPARCTGHSSPRTHTLLVVAGKSAQDNCLPAPRTIPTAIGTRLFQVRFAVGGKQEARAEGARQEAAGGADVPHDVGLWQQLGTLGTPESDASAARRVWFQQPPGISIHSHNSINCGLAHQHESPATDGDEFESRQRVFLRWKACELELFIQQTPEIFSASCGSSADTRAR